MEHLPVRVDKECFKLKDARVQRLLSGRLSTDAFALTLLPGDPFVLIGDTIYALTEQEFYALKAVLPINIMTEEAFHRVIEMPDLSFMQPQDMTLIASIKEKLPTCRSCQYKRYKEQVYSLVKKYKLELPMTAANAADADKSEYPEQTEAVLPVVFSLIDHLYEMPKQERKSCIDCVEKHIAQAYVLSREFLLGYPEYQTLVIGHLGEAIDELPKVAFQLKQTLEFCMARTKYTNAPFIPIQALSTHILALRKSSDASSSNLDALPVDLEIDFTSDMKAELLNVDSITLSAAADRLNTIIEDFTLGVENLDEVSRLQWEGAMAATADFIVNAAPITANMIRNRRLLFVADPSMADTAGYSLRDVYDYVIQILSSRQQE